ncbi:alpha-E domain-containing protein [Marinobacter salinexigens]|uniref:Alpha-E domain-containing protein n=1 Tax=Marinobacter salinexigens TaxID=2919747 RepID=A0A5B0VD20_9GAMM|nr:alpha-E domain-containing protein [Marinobacter salinexigens]KAA1171939.1 alpha-E domain-containing protein [Marinobacter salinexigens]
MLSKVAERLYWAARYMERVENTARLVGVYDKLLFDLPRDVNISWYSLVELNSVADLFSERYQIRSEHNVVKFMLADDSNPSSMLSSLHMLRENIRTSRDVLPVESWEYINELYLYAVNNIRLGINRSKRHEFLDQIVSRCQMLYGLFSSTMSHDAPWQFIKLGRNLERADMTTRIVDAGASALLAANGDANINLRKVVWTNVLLSASAYTSYRRSVRLSVAGPYVASYLLEDEYFPRSVASCLTQLRISAGKLPHCDKVVELIKKVDPGSHPIESESDLGLELREFLNDLQIALSHLGNRIAQTWFPA